MCSVKKKKKKKKKEGKRKVPLRHIRPFNYKRGKHFYSALSSFSKHVAHIAHNAAEPQSDITGGSLLDYTELHLEPQKLICLFFHICSCTLKYL